MSRQELREYTEKLRKVHRNGGDSWSAVKTMIDVACREIENPSLKSPDSIRFRNGQPHMK